MVGRVILARPKLLQEREDMFLRQSGFTWLVVGLGNPGQKYEHTRHNMGFLTVDVLAEKLNVKLNKVKFKSAYNIVRFGGQKCLVMKPQTYMNLSGESVREIVSYYDIDLEDLIVIYDDFDLEIGTIRIRKKGSAGSHNGMKSIIGQIQSKDFPRIRIGIGKSGGGAEWKDFVLGKTSKQDEKLIEDAVDRAADAVGCILEKGIDKAMNEYNVKPGLSGREDRDKTRND